MALASVPGVTSSGFCVVPSASFRAAGDEAQCEDGLKRDRFGFAVTKLKAKTGSGVARIARELALEFSSAEFAPDFGVHTPGVALRMADAVSCRFQPGPTSFVAPRELEGVQEVAPPSRTPELFEALRPPKL